MRVGLLGAGRIGVMHAENIATLPDVSELVIADVDEARAREVAAKIGAASSTAVVTASSPAVVSATIDAVLAPSRVDAVVIAAATTAHTELVHRAADAGLPIFCEKPLAPDVAGTLAVLQHVAAAGVSLQMGFMRRFDAGYRAARTAAQSGELGVVHCLQATTFDLAPPHAAYFPSSGGIFRDCLIHDFDIIRFVTGREIVSVYATGGNKGASFIADAGDVDTAVAALVLDDGTVASALGGRYNGGGYDVRLEVHGSAGTIAVGIDDRSPIRSAEPGVSWPPDPPYDAFAARFAGAYRQELTDFLAHVRGEIPNPCPAADALEALYVAEAAQLSRDGGRVVLVREVR